MDGKVVLQRLKDALEKLRASSRADEDLDQFKDDLVRIIEKEEEDA